MGTPFLRIVNPEYIKKFKVINPEYIKKFQMNRAWYEKVTYGAPIEVRKQRQLICYDLPWSRICYLGRVADCTVTKLAPD